MFLPDEVVKLHWEGFATNGLLRLRSVYEFIVALSIIDCQIDICLYAEITADYWIRLEDQKNYPIQMLVIRHYSPFV